MNQRTFTLTILLTLITTCRLLPVQLILPTWVSTTHGAGPQSDPESLLAAGERIALGCADLSALELIPGVSDSLAEALLAKRTAIALAHQTSPITTSLELARGVGPRNAASLARYLGTGDTCEGYETYKPFAPVATRDAHYQTQAQSFNDFSHSPYLLQERRQLEPRGKYNLVNYANTRSHTDSRSP